MIGNEREIMIHFLTERARARKRQFLAMFNHFQRRRQSDQQPAQRHDDTPRELPLITPSFEKTPETKFFLQGYFRNAFCGDFARNACAATAVLNAVSMEYTFQTGNRMDPKRGEPAMRAAVDAGHINCGGKHPSRPAFVNNWGMAANSMWHSLGQKGAWTYITPSNGQYVRRYIIHAIRHDYPRCSDARHFVNYIGEGKYRDTNRGHFGYVANLQSQVGRPTRYLYFLGN